MAEIYQLGEMLIHSLKKNFFASISSKIFRNLEGDLVCIGGVGAIGAEQLLNNEIIDEDLIQDIIKIAEEGKYPEQAALALLGIEIAKKEGKYIPIILKAFNSTQSNLLLNHLEKIT